MAAFKPIPLVVSLGAAFLLSGCVIAKPFSAAEEEVKNDLNVSNYYPATRETRDNIQTQPLFAQAAFWGREYDLNPSDLESAIKLSAAVRKLGNSQRAIEIAQTTRALYPRDPYLTAEFAAALIASERALDAMQPLDAALRVAPNYARLWSLKGAALDQTEQYDLARKHYDRALRITPRDPNILANLGLSYALSGDPVTAEKWLRRASSLPGAGAGVHQNLALVLQLQGKTAEADKLSRLSRGDQRLPPPPVPAHQPQSQPLQPANYRNQAPQNLRRPNQQTQNGQPSRSQPLGRQQTSTGPAANPQNFKSSSEAARHAARQIQQRPKGAQPNALPTAGDLTQEQRTLLSQIAGNLNPQQAAQRQQSQRQGQTQPQTNTAPPGGYPAQAYAPQSYQPPATQIQTRSAQPSAQSLNTAPRGAARRRR